jgi:betaine-aldehyde dehydrogenase
MGVCGLITPWNFPLVITCWKLGPALAAGNTVVLKPAEWTPLTALRLGELALEAGFPEGVINVCPGRGAVAGAALTAHSGVRKVSFTGSTKTGQEIMRSAAGHTARVSLELGGKSASIVFADADLDKASGSCMSVFDNTGQDCCARSRYLVERSVFDEVVEKFVAQAKAIKVGDPNDDATELGPLVHPDHLKRVAGFVDRASAAGVKVHCGGGVPIDPELGKGCYYMPTVLSGAAPDSEIAQEEVFGPVVVFIPFDSEEEAIALANGTRFGLSGSIWTKDISRALRVARAVEAGVQSINTSSSVHLEMPFGGFKESGIGRELGIGALEAYTEQKTVFIAE